MLGTLGGVTASYLFQRKIAAHSESTARDERLRQERLATCSAFAGALMELRRVQMDRWHRSLSDRAYRTDPREARAESYRMLASAWSAFYRFRLTTSDAHLNTLAAQALEAAAQLSDAADDADLRQQAEQAGTRIDAFVTAAAHYLEAGDVGATAPPYLKNPAVEAAEKATAGRERLDLRRSTGSGSDW